MKDLGPELHRTVKWTDFGGAWAILIESHQWAKSLEAKLVVGMDDARTTYVVIAPLFP
jgi:hypothetical protein